MSDILSSIQSACSKALETTKELSAELPGSKTTQALVVGAAVGTAVYFFFLKTRYRLPPGPFALPILGNILDVADKKEPFYMKLKRWADEKYGPVILIYLGPFRCVTLNRLDVVTEAYIERGVDFTGRPQFHSMSVFSEGYNDILFASPNAAWKLQRKIATKALRHYMKGQHLEKVVHHVVTMVTDKMLAEADAFDPSRYIGVLMFHIIETICFGKMKDYDDPEILRLIWLLDVINEDLGLGFWEDALPLLKYFPTEKFRKFEKRMQEFLDYNYDRIDEHRKTFSENNIRDITDSILLAQKEAEREESAEVMAMFTNTHVGQLVGNIFGGGVDTSRHTLQWCLGYMAGYPQEQALVQAEIDEVTGAHLPGETDRAKLVYTEATLYEAMRIASVVPLGLPRETLSDTSVGGYDIPKGTMVLVNQWALLNDPEQWENPEEFNPKRFIDEAGKLRSKLPSWLPFSTGRRACVGEFVAKPQLLMIFACIMKRCKISLPPGVVFDPNPKVASFLSHIPKPFQIVVTSR
ncbi:cytochrome P450 1A1-like [Littorina saxatilis]|uniref:Cytochrome P450 n=1 Tax=Littorina saxatilis TaxID=31220 RepID=A0AAN9APB6_9CAEN